MKISKIGILTSGGDAPGMNSALFGVYSACQENNITLIGFKGGYNGLIDNDYIEIDGAVLDGRINQGGTILKSSRAPRFLKSAYFTGIGLTSQNIALIIGSISICVLVAKSTSPLK